MQEKKLIFLTLDTNRQRHSPRYRVKRLFGDCKIPKPKTKEEEQLFDGFDNSTDLMKEFEDK